MGGTFVQNQRDKNFNQQPLNQIYTDESPHDEIISTTDDDYYYIDSLFVVTAEEAKLPNTFSESYDFQKLFGENVIFNSCENSVNNITSDINVTEQLKTTFKEKQQVKEAGSIEKFLTKIVIGNYPVKVLVDSSASVNVLNKTFHLETISFGKE